MTRLLKLFVASLVAAPLLASAAVPGTINFSARIADNGRPVTGSQAFTFTLWTVETGGDPAVDVAWTEGPRNITVTDGVVATALGDVANGGTALPAFTGTDLFLEVTMGSATFPRLKLHSVPYALRAGVADSVPWSGVTGAPALPGAASGGVTSTGAFGNTDTLLASATVTFPAAGWAFVMSQASTAQNSTTPNQILFCSLREDGTLFKDMWWEAYKNDGFYGNWQSGAVVKAVTAGAHTYQFYCRTNAGSAFATMGQIHVLYFPTSL